MNADRLLDAFNRLGDEPETVQQFRKLVVGLAMSGKLVAPHEAVMDPASLLKQIEVKKRILVQQGVIRKQNPSAALSLEDLPKGFNNPANFVRLGSIARIEKGLTGIMKAEPGPYPLVVTAEDRTTCDHFDFDGAATIVPLVSSAGHGKASLQRLHYQEGKFALGSILAAIFPHAPELISARFLFEYLTAFKDELLVSQMIGTANVSLSVGKVSDVPVPLISPSTQRKVDEMMALCDRLEAARAGREGVRDRLAAASLARLNAPDPETFQADAGFALDALPALTTRPDQIKALRQAILNLAVRGKLVPQDPKDEPAFELLKRIRAWQRREIEQKRIRAPRKPLAPIKADDSQYPKPTGWAFARLGELIYIQSGDGLTAANMKDGPVPVFGGNGINGYHDQSNVYQPTIVIGRVGYYCGSIHVAPPSAWITDNAFITHFSQGDIYLRFLVLLLTGTNLKEDENATAQPVISGSKIYPIVVGLPPLAEQHRIVAKVDALIALCDQLEASLNVTAATCRRLLDALLADALAPTDTRELEAAE
ncbi:restriction endonuclease subunit S [Mesorhizobium sp. M1428]|uniref:restriction endonuclease subunit S n=1 Tax=Mesorhizobium sp. M1428 TaxID=2957102 RepID=UPI0033382903